MALYFNVRAPAEKLPHQRESDLAAALPDHSFGD
jgi:hypothetical protein